MGRRTQTQSAPKLAFQQKGACFFNSPTDFPQLIGIKNRTPLLVQLDPSFLSFAFPNLRFFLSCIFFFTFFYVYHF